LKEATSVKKGWVAVGLVLLISGLAGFQFINSSAYAQTLENGTVNTSQPVADLPSNPPQYPGQDSLIATPGLSADDLNPGTQQDSSITGADEIDQQNPTPNTATSSQNIAEEQGLNTGRTIGNSIVQDPVPEGEELENSQPTIGEQINQPDDSDNTETDDNDNTETDDNDNGASGDRQQGNQKADDADDGGDQGDRDEEDEEDQEDQEDQEDSGSKEEIPSSIRNWLPFP
jgi:hypothetical protein